MAYTLFKPELQEIPDRSEWYRVRTANCYIPDQDGNADKRYWEDSTIHVNRPLDKWSVLDKVEFNVCKFNNRPKPKDRKRIAVISCFSEFGCETIGCMYCIPRFIQRYPGLYYIAMGWYGREYLYRHLVDEFWEIKEEYMWLRQYARAFTHKSQNLSRIEYGVVQNGHGAVIQSSMLGRYAIGNNCRTCGKFWSGWKERSAHCPSCKSTVITRSIFSDIAHYKKQAVPIPLPSKTAMDWARALIPPNTVGVFARGRKAYGRNLESSFYINLINLLKKKGYNVIWLGEKQSVQPCPVDDVLDFSQMVESRDLEKTLAIIANLKFTIQFWTASTRLSSIVGTPFILVESPQQILPDEEGGQEGARLQLTNFSNYKLCLCNFGKALHNPQGLLKLMETCVEQVEQADYSQVDGLIMGDELAFFKDTRREMK